ncbi:hypothetical protein [Treponema sp.]|uniref:hypothetical protein n=1 Tax=Treponema sp. TaxID=166 RepID=UPI0025F3F716|nr:hypothetical protein [Treponema sp.]MCR5218830.1 hypothetical protein [Treponema sp.]
MKKITFVSAAVTALLLISELFTSCSSSGLTPEEKRLKKLQAKQKKDAYTGWIYVPERKFSITKDDIKIDMNGSTGTFGLYAIPEQGDPVPLLSNYDSFTSTFVSVKIGRKEYRLNRENGVKSEARRTPYGAQMCYTLSNQAQVVVDFSFLPSIATSSRVDMLRVTIYTINLGRSTQSFTVKSVFDTILGENTTTHFSTAARSRINTEVQYLTMADHLWVRSSNENTSLQFLLSGKGISSPSHVTLANKDSLAESNWVPQVMESKSFNSVISYNNSAVGLNWKTAYLDPYKTDVITFYLSVGIGGNEPAGKDFLKALEEGKTALAASLPDFAPYTNVAPSPSELTEDELQTPYYENMPVIPGQGNIPEADSEKNAKTEAPAKEENLPETENTSAGDNTLPADAEPEEKVVITKMQLNPEYIQQLLDHIAELEAGDPGVNKAEIDALNSELDGILLMLKSME